MIKRLKTYLKSTFVRYIVSYLLLMALLVGGLTVYMYSYYRSNVYETTTAEETLRTWQLKYKADGAVLSLEGIAKLYERAELSPTELINEFSPEEGTVYIYDAARGTVYYDNGFESAETWLNSLDYENLTQTELNSELFDSKSFSIITAQNISRNGINDRLLTLVIPAGSRGSVIWTLCEDALLSLETDKSSGGNRYIIQDSEIRARSESVSVSESKVLEAGAYVTGPISEIKKLSGVNYLLTAVPGERDGVVYVSVQPLSGIRVKAMGVWLGFMAVLLALALPTTLFMVYISRKNFAPIMAMGRHFGGRKDRYSDDISAIVSGIEELEGRNREIETDSLAARRHLYARGLVTGLYADDESAKQAGSELGYDIDRKHYAVLLVGSDREQAGQSFIDRLTALAGGDTCCMGTELIENSQCMLICFADDTALFQSFGEQLVKDAQIMSHKLPVAISAPHSALKEISEAYLEAGSAYESRFFMGENTLLRFDRIPFAAGKSDLETKDHAGEIKKALVDGDMAKVDKCLERLRSTLTGENMNLFSFRQVYNDVIGAIMSEAEGQHYSNADVYDLFSLSGCHSLEELEQVLRSVCKNIISTRSSEDRLPPIQRATRLMAANYTDSDFNLSKAAELAGVTSARLTGEFKSKLGVTPMDYLTMLRMEKAKKLLLGTDLPIAEICRQSGYVDASSFTRRFKQYFGVTPLQFRQNGASDKGERS